ncbi:a-factor receptor [Marasmius sp. AFHP31]|nr:a-factor receptor [Marasmius sp. AFHP31]
MADPAFPFFPIFAFITFILALIPLPWHLQQWNAGTCLFMFWTSIVCLIHFVNALIWHGNVRNVAPVWCDISSQIIIASNAGLAAATVCISRRLYMITALRGFYSSKAERRRALGKDLSICIGIPLLVCVLHLIVQPYRFDILEDVGCYPATYNTLLAYVLHYMWPIAMGLISFIYGCLALRLFHIRRAEISRLMAGDKDSAALTISRYFRLMILALIHVICTIPTGVFAIFHGATQMNPYGSYIRRDWTKVRTILGEEWRADQMWYGMVEINRWMPIFCGVVFFLLFGFALEARRSYAMAWKWLVSKFKRRNDGLPPPQRPKWQSWGKQSSISGSTVVGDTDSVAAKRLPSYYSSRSSNAGSFTSAVKPASFAAAADKAKPTGDSEYEDIRLSPISAITPSSETPTTTNSSLPLLAPHGHQPRTHARNSSIMQFNPNTGVVQPLINVTHDTNVESRASEDNVHDNDEGTITYYVDPKYGLLSKKDYDTIYPPSGR